MIFFDEFPKSFESELCDRFIISRNNNIFLSKSFIKDDGSIIVGVFVR